MDESLLHVVLLFWKMLDISWKQKFTTESEVFQGLSGFQLCLHNRLCDEKNLIGLKNHIIEILEFEALEEGKQRVLNLTVRHDHMEFVCFRKLGTEFYARYIATQFFRVR